MSHLSHKVAYPEGYDSGLSIDIRAEQIGPHQIRYAARPDTWPLMGHLLLAITRAVNGAGWGHVDREMMRDMKEQDQSVYVIDIMTHEGPVKSCTGNLTQWPYMLGLLTLVSNLFHGFMTLGRPGLPEVGSVWLRKDPDVPFSSDVIVVHQIGWSEDHGEANPYWYVSDASGDSWKISDFYNLFDEAVVMSLAEYERQKRCFEDPDLLRLLAEEAEIERSTREAHNKPVRVRWPTQNGDYWHINGDLVNVQFFTNLETEQTIVRTHCYTDGFEKFFSTPEEFWSLHTEMTDED